MSDSHETPGTQNHGWSKWEEHVLHELERLTESNKSMMTEFHELKVQITQELARKSEVEDLRAKLTNMQIGNSRSLSEVEMKMINKIGEIREKHGLESANVQAELKMKSGLYGELAGMIPVVIALTILVIQSLMK